MTVARTRVEVAGMERGDHTPDTLGRWSLEDLLTGQVWAIREKDYGFWGEEGEGQGLHLLSWGRRWRRV